MNRLGFRLGGAAIGVLIGVCLAAIADITVDVFDDLSGLSLRRNVESLLPYAWSSQYGYTLVVGFFSALGGILISENAN
jgi:hypothetical protein